MEPLHLPGLRTVVPSGGFEVERDIVYHRADGRDLHLDRYRPVQGDGSLVLLLHGEPALEEGDAWWGEDRRVKDCQPLRDWGALLASRGCTAVVANHRCSSGFEHPEAVDEDLDALVSFLGGGEHAWFAFSGAVPFAITHAIGDPRATGIATMYGPLDLDEPELKLWFPGLGDARTRAWSPVARITDAGWPAHLHVWPEQDWLPNGAERFEEAAAAVGVNVGVLTHPDGRHGFDFVDDDDTTRAIIGEVVEFFAG